MSARSPDPTLRVAYVLKKYPRLSETFILEEVLGLEAAGVDVSIFSLRLPDEGRFHQALARVRAPVEYLPPVRSASVLESFRTLSGLPGTAPERLSAALAFVDRLPGERRAELLLHGVHLAGSAVRRGIQHLHAHFMTVAAHTAYVAHLLTDIPFTVTAHAKDIYRHTVDRTVVREVAAAATSVVTVCEANRRYLEDRLLSPGIRVERVYNGIALDELPREPMARDPGLILAAGRLVEKKGFHILLEACRLLADWGVEFRCVVLGDGEERERLLEQRARLGLGGRVALAGALPREDILGWMRRARALAAPCLTGTDGNRDALPTVLLEALALGLPAVTTPVGGIPEIVDQRVEGLLVREGDPSALAEALRRVLADDGLWRELATAGPRKAAARFDRRISIPHLIRVFRNQPVRPAGVARGVA